MPRTPTPTKGRHRSWAVGLLLPAGLWLLPQFGWPADAPVDDVATEGFRMRTVDGGVIAQAAAARLHEWLDHRASRVEVVPDMTAIRTTAVPDGALSVEARAIPDGIRPASRMAVWVDLSVGGRVVRSILVACRVRAFQRVWTAATEIAPGARLDLRSLRREEVDVAALDALPWTGELTHATLRRRLRRDGVLMADAMVETPAVARGQPVVVVSRVGAAEVTTRAVALQSGAVGQNLRIRAGAASESIEATVVAAGRVEVWR